MQKLAYVDSLRGIAIILVVVVHTSESVTGLPLWLHNLFYFGKYGVQLFFMMSAYTLCLSWLNRKDTVGRLKKYFIRRFFRIAPLYYAGVLIYGIIWVLRNKYGVQTYLMETDYSIVNVVSNLTFTNSLSAHTYSSVVPGGWSIGTEMVFYTLFPFLFELCFKMKPLLRIALPFLLAALIFLFFRSLPHLFPPISRHNFEFYYCFILNQLPIFILGIVLFFYSDFKVGITGVIACLAIFVLLFSVISFFFSKGVGDITLTPFCVGISFIFLIVAFKNSNILNSGFIQWMGRLSFSIYVFHFIFAWWLSAYLNEILTPQLKSYIIFLICFSITFVCSILISVITKLVIEDHGIRLGGLIIKKIQLKAQTNDKN